MTINVTFTDEPTRVLADAGRFLESGPVLHNLILSLLHERVAHPLPGRYWVASSGDGVVGVVFQSPLMFDATITPMQDDTVTAVVAAIVEVNIALPGVVGDASTAARFAGEWATLRRCAVRPSEGQRIYELGELQEGRSVDGGLRTAMDADRDLIMTWFQGFQEDVGEPGGDTGRNVDARLSAGEYALWENGEPVSMAFASLPVAGVSRIGAVYTPPAHRNHGYAEACVRELSRGLLQRNVRSMLYTQLENPTSNAIYHRIGYRAIAEALRYRFTSVHLARST